MRSAPRVTHHRTNGLLCEACVEGCVVQGGEHFTFGDDDELGEVEVSLEIDLRR